ncbi:MAG: hypothetical protein Q7R85_02335 [bacterium]|nr:hypothetical protein [bacterium]
MNILDASAIVGLVLTCLIFRYSLRALKAQLAREAATRDVELQKEHGAWVRKIQAREAALRPPSEN